jgi:hypothetical protein
LDRLAARHPQGWLVLHGGDGAWPNALGYASVSHVLYAPQLDWFRRFFPELPESDIQQLFNRTLYTVLSGRTQPTLIGAAEVWVPIDVFDPPLIPVTIGGEGPGNAPQDGAIESLSAFVENGVNHVLMAGWAPMDGSDPASALRVLTRLPVKSAIAYPSLRGAVSLARDDPGLTLSGFEIRLVLATSATTSRELAAALRREPLCVIAESPTRGRTFVRGGMIRAEDCPAP